MSFHCIRNSPSWSPRGAEPMRSRSRTAGWPGRRPGPPTRAVPWPLPALDPSWSSSTVEVQGVAGHDLAAEAGLVDPAEERQLAGVALVGQQGDPPSWAKASTISTPGRVGRPGKWPAKKASSPREVPAPARRARRDDLGHLVDEQERRPVRQSTSSGRGRPRQPSRPSVPHPEAAVDGDHGAGDVAAAASDASQVTAAATSSGRPSASAAPVRRSRPARASDRAGGHVGGDESGGDDIDGDAPAADLAGQ